MSEKNKKKNNNKGVESTGATVRKLDPKKLIVILVVMVVVVAVALIADRQINSRPINDINDASNRMLAAGVFSTHPEIDYETAVSIVNLDTVKINGKTYFPVEVTLHYDTPEEKVLPMYYVEQQTGDIFQDDGTGKLVPWGV